MTPKPVDEQQEPLPVEEQTLTELKVEPVAFAAEEAKENGKNKKIVECILAGERVITESSDEARELYNQSRFGSTVDNGKVELSLLEALYLMERGRLSVRSESGRIIAFESYLK